MPEPSVNRPKRYPGSPERATPAEVRWNILMSDPTRYRENKRHDLFNTYMDSLSRIKSGTYTDKSMSIPAYLQEVVNEANYWANDFLENAYYVDKQTGEEGIITPMGYYRRNENGSYSRANRPATMSRDEFMDRAYRAMESYQNYDAVIRAGNEAASYYKWKLDTSKIDPFVGSLGIIYNQYGDMRTQGLGEQITPTDAFRERYENFMKGNYNRNVKPPIVE